MASFVALVACLALLGEAHGLLYELGPGPQRFGEAIARIDDGSMMYTLNTPFPFFGIMRDTIFVNTNGDVSFSGGIGHFTPQSLTTFNREIIAPFWADVNTDVTIGNGDVFFLETTDEMLLENVTMDIQFAFEAHPSFTATSVIVVTWFQVLHFESSLASRSNTFQCVLVTDGDLSFVFFVYERITWTTGSASGGVDGFGGTQALAGISAGDGIRYYQLPESLTDEILYINGTSNVDIPGVWMFQVDTDLVFPQCSSDQNAAVFLSSHVDSVLGGTAFEVFGPCMRPDDNLTCIFDSTPVPATFINENSAVCLSPRYLEHGRRQFTFTILQSGTETYRQDSFIYAQSIEERHDVEALVNSPLLLPGEPFTINWNSRRILPDGLAIPPTVTVTLYRLNFQTFDVSMATVLSSSIPNTGSTVVTIPDLPSLSGDVLPVILRVAAFNNTEIGGMWGTVLFYSASTANLRSTCRNWNNNQPTAFLDIFNALPPCPPTRSRARRDSMRFTADTGSRASVNRIYRSEAAECYRQASSNINSFGAGQQCCYDSSGMLITGFGSGAGSPNIVAIGGSSVDTFQHLQLDVLPYVFCCFGTSPDCASYYQRRPSNNGIGYRLRPPACVFGDPHMITLDGLRYTYNGYGQFLLIQTVASALVGTADSFVLQGRMTQAQNTTGAMVDATAFTAIVARQNNSAVVQFSAFAGGLFAFVDGQIVLFGEISEESFPGVVVTNQGNNVLSAAFSNGAYIEATGENGIISILFVSLPENLRGAVEGMMGNFNGDPNDDLRFRYVPDMVDPNDAQAIYDFGNSWALQPETDQIYFTYHAGEDDFSYLFFQFTPTFETTFSNLTFRDTAVGICGDDPFCLFDIAVTENLDLGRSTLQAVQEFNTTVDLSAPIVCNPACSNGACVSNNTCSCSTGFSGTLCDQLVVEHCQDNPCGAQETCIVQAGSYFCVDCASDPTNPHCVAIENLITYCNDGVDSCENGVCSCLTGFAAPDCCNCASGFFRLSSTQLCLPYCSDGVDSCDNGVCQCLTGYAEPSCCDCEPGYTRPTGTQQCLLQCAEEVDRTYSISWPTTTSGVIWQAPCAGEAVGTALRLCTTTGNWSTFIDTSNCTTPAFNDIMMTAEQAFADEDLNQVEDVVETLADLTDPVNTGGTQLGGDLQITNNIISMAVAALSEGGSSGTNDPTLRAFNRELFQTIDNVLHEGNEEGWESLQVKSVGSEMLLQSAEDYGRYAAIALRSDTIATDNSENITLAGANIDLSAKRVSGGVDIKNIIYREQNTQATIPAELLVEKGAEFMDITVVNIYLKTIDEFLPTTNLSENSTTGTAVISTQIFTGDVREIERNRNFVEFVFVTDIFYGQNVTKPECTFFDLSASVEDSAWTTDNVETVSVSRIERQDGNIQFQVVCRSFHFTSFAVLVDVNGALRNISDTQRLALDIISYIGCAVSILCCLLTIIFLLIVVGREMFQKVYFMVHFNLAIALMLALILFVAGIDTAARNRGACLFVALGLHYLFTAVFCWMLCEGVMLYLMLVVVFSKITSKWWFFLLLGWGTPILPVVITVAARHQDYASNDINGDGENDYCWLSTDDPAKGVIWGFVAPMLAIILINLFFLIMALRALWKVRTAKQKESTRHFNKKEFIALSKKLCCASVVLLPLLGLTWVFGLLAVNGSTIVFAYLFTIFNSLQGLFIFIFHVVRSEKVWGKLTNKIENRRLRSTYKRSTRLSSLSSNRTDSLRKDLTGRSTGRMKGALASISEEKPPENALSFHNPISEMEEAEEPWPDDIEQLVKAEEGEVFEDKPE